MPDQDIPGPQFVKLWLASDNQITVTMDPAESIAGWAITFEVLDDQGLAVVTKTTSGGITITDPVNGVFKVALSPDTAALVAGALYEYKARRTDTGERFVIAWGQLIVK